MNSFADRTVRPMLIGETSEPFDSDDYLFELKLDGLRCLMYLEKDRTEIRNKRNLNITEVFPEFHDLYKHVKTPCLLDGELIVYEQGMIDFFALQLRAHQKNPFRAKLASKSHPAHFTAFDILYAKDKWIMDQPLTKRKQLLNQTVRSEYERFSVSRTIEHHGSALYRMTVEKNLEGIVAKEKSSTYIPDSRTKKWIKVKNLMDDDYVICGYIPKHESVISLVLSQYEQGKLTYCGHVTMGVRNLHFIKDQHISVLKECPLAELPLHHEEAIWLEPKAVAVVKFMMKTESGSLRQPIFKGFRTDKNPKDCIRR